MKINFDDDSLAPVTMEELTEWKNKLVERGSVTGDMIVPRLVKALLIQYTPNAVISSDREVTGEVEGTNKDRN